MAKDSDWTAVYEVVKEALVEDEELHRNPPRNEEEVGYVAETVADHLVGKFQFVPRN